MDNYIIQETDVAIIGISCKFPKADNINDYYKNIVEGKICFNYFTNETQDNLTPFERSSGGNYIPISSTIENIKGFDADFFNISPQEAAIMDPQHRLLLECAWKALEDSGYIQQRSSLNIGVYSCSGKNTYLLSNILNNEKICNNTGLYQMMIGNYNDFISTRLSYKLGLTGPSISLQSACSSSLVALHYACQDLIENCCKIAIVGASTLRSPQEIGYVYEESGIFSQSGECLPFDDKANGTIPGNGLGVVVLKKLKDAVNDNDQIYAVVKGCSVNCDGNEKVGYTAPSIEGQRKVIIDCLQRSGVSPEQIEMIEAHGTGTRIGDPIEFEALRQAYKTNKKKYCAISSVKWQIGHLDAAAGMAGLIKCILCLKHKIIPPSPYISKINQYINMEDSPFYMSRDTKAWESCGKYRYAAISSFGLGGTNSHAILMEAPQKSNIETEIVDNSHPVILPFSAKSPKALKALVDEYAVYFSTNTNINLSNVSYTLWNKRNHFKENRSFIICNTLNEAIEKLKNDYSEPYRLLNNVYIDITPYLSINTKIKNEAVSNISSIIYTAYCNYKYKFEVYNLLTDCLCFALALYDYFNKIGLKTNFIYDDVQDNHPNNSNLNLFIDNLKNRYSFVSYNNISGNNDSLLIAEKKIKDGVKTITIEDMLYAEIYNILGNLWISGNDIPSNYLGCNKPKRHISLPTYQFQHKNYWIDAINQSSNMNEHNPLNDDSDMLKTVISLWKNILGVDTINADDDFFDIGGDSLSAVRFLSQINSKYKIRISMDEFVNLTSAKNVKDMIENKRNNQFCLSTEIKLFEENPLRKMKDGNNNSPIIFFHPAGGTTFCYHELLKSAQLDSSIYGFQFPTNLLNQDLKKIPELSKLYFDIISREIGNDCYCLVGYSLGGNIAFEIATLMQEAGITISGLYLIDSHAPIVYNKAIDSPDSIMECFPFILKSFLKIDVNDISSNTNIKHLYSQLKSSNNILNEISLGQFTMLYDVWKYNHLSLRTYEHKHKFRGKVVLFEANEQESEDVLKKMNMELHTKEEWQKYVEGELQIISVPGNHYTMLSTPHVETLRLKLSSFFNKTK